MIYDSDMIAPALRVRIIRAIVSSGKKYDVVIGPAGAGKTSFVHGRGQYVNSLEDVASADSFIVVSASARSKKNSSLITDQLNSIIAKASSVAYLYVNNLELRNRRNHRIVNGALDNRTKKELIATKFAPLNEYDFINSLKKICRTFKMIRN